MNTNEIKVLDHGFVKLVDHMGDDMRIVNAARTSYGQQGKGDAKDKGLINYLMRNHHTSPFEQVQFTFHQKLPILVARQQVRHRTAKLNEISGRYAVLKDEFYIPNPERMQKQSEANHQGSAPEMVDHAEQLIDELIHSTKEAYQTYEKLLESGLSKELARSVLPVNLYTEWYWTIDLHNLFHFLRLRLDHHAQWEIREYAQAMYTLIQPIVPWACEAFEEHIQHAVTFSRSEFQLLRALLVALPPGKVQSSVQETESLSKTQKADLLRKLDI